VVRVQVVGDVEVDDVGRSLEQRFERGQRGLDAVFARERLGPLGAGGRDRDDLDTYAVDASPSLEVEAGGEPGAGDGDADPIHPDPSRRH